MILPDHSKTKEASDTWLQAAKSNPLNTVLFALCVLAFSGGAIFLSAYISAKATQLAQVTEKVNKLESSMSEISLVLETLVVSQVITKLEGGNTIILDYDPLPQSLKIINGPLLHLPRPEYGYELEGKLLKITQDQTLEILTSQLEKGGLTVEYIRKVNLEK